MEDFADRSFGCALFLMAMLTVMIIGTALMLNVVYVVIEGFLNSVG